MFVTFGAPSRLGDLARGHAGTRSRRTARSGGRSHRASRRSRSHPPRRRGRSVRQARAVDRDEDCGTIDERGPITSSSAMRHVPRSRCRLASRAVARDVGDVDTLVDRSRPAPGACRAGLHAVPAESGDLHAESRPGAGRPRECADTACSPRSGAAPASHERRVRGPRRRPCRPTAPARARLGRPRAGRSGPISFTVHYAASTGESFQVGGQGDSISTSEKPRPSSCSFDRACGSRGSAFARCLAGIADGHPLDVDRPVELGDQLANAKRRPRWARHDPRASSTSSSP